VKRAIEDGFGFVRVRGEISGYRGPHSSGHAYFSLKDEGANRVPYRDRACGTS
jgi:exodeoxyribonuclease VII large subunit